MQKYKLPSGWNEDRVNRILTHYEDQTEDEAVSEDETIYSHRDQTVMEIPSELVPVVRELLAKYTEEHEVPALNSANVP